MENKFFITNNKLDLKNLIRNHNIMLDFFIYNKNKYNYSNNKND